MEQTLTWHLQNIKTWKCPRCWSLAEPGAQSKLWSEERQLLQIPGCAALRTGMKSKRGKELRNLSVGMPDQVSMADQPGAIPFLCTGGSAVSPVQRINSSTGSPSPGMHSPSQPCLLLLLHLDLHLRLSSICLSSVAFPTSPPVAFCISITMPDQRHTSLKSEIWGCQHSTLQPSSCP